MSTSPTASPELKLSDEIQDVVHLARKAAAEDKIDTLQDRHYLDAMLRGNRRFTRLDAVLRAAGAPPGKLRQLYKLRKPVAAKPLGTSHVLESAAEIARHPSAEGQPPPKPSRLEIEHLLLALSKSADPLVSDVFAGGHLTPEKLAWAIQKTEKGGTGRFFLYCLKETVEVILVVLLLVIMIKQGLGEFRLIPSESMLPTLRIGDRILVEKVTHWFRPIHRGDILVFYPPEPESILRQDPMSIFLRVTGFSGILFDKESKVDTAFIKRVVGLPGDIIDVRPNEGVFLNGKLLDEPYVAEVANMCTFLSACGPTKVPDDMLYMMGDNRNHSADSRYWYFLPEDRVIGRAVFRFFPVDKRLGPL